jgi:RNA polymerase sigma-70 factor (ECF subfamily)
VRLVAAALHPRTENRVLRNPDGGSVRSGTVDDAELIARLRRGDEQAFEGLIAAHHTAMIRVAQGFVPTRGLAEEVVQETWVGMLRGLDRFEGRSSLKTWLYAILINQARSMATRERRTVPFDHTDDARAEDPARFAADGSWAQPPVPFTEEIEERLVHAPMLAQLSTALDDLPPAQRTVVTLRDIEQLTSDEVCAMLEITPANQRVLLHRGRAGLRRSIEALLEGGN